jgi:death on curing protein
VRFPDVADILTLHERILAETPEDTPRLPGVRDRGAIEAAIERAQWGPFEVGDVAERAALLLRGIAQDHPFVDGNKRTAFLATYAFLRENGRRLDASRADVVAFMLSVAQAEIDIDDIAAWIRAQATNV